MIDNDWKSLGETVVFNKPEYFASLEEFRRGDDQMVFGHLSVRKWNKSVLKEIIKNWGALRSFVTCPIYAVSEDGSPKFESFISFLGFKPLTEIICQNGEKRRLFIHFIKEKKNNEFNFLPEHKQHQREHDLPVVGATAVPDAGV
jgi:hypothetical protein